MSTAASFYRQVPISAEHDRDPLADSCCICYHAYSFDPMNSEAEDPVQLVCGHVFGTTCIEKWVRTNSTCPLCRAQLNFQSKTDEEAIIDSLSYTGHFSWHREVDHETDANGESEAEYFDAQEEFETPRHIHYHPSEDIWLTLAYYEDLTKLYTPLKPSFSFDISKVELCIDDCFHEFVDCHNELVDCHEQWMSDFIHHEHDTGAIGFSDVSSC
jgi:hypothetical protein